MITLRVWVEVCCDRHHKKADLQIWKRPRRKQQSCGGFQLIGHNQRKAARHLVTDRELDAMGATARVSSALKMHGLYRRA
jgi:hypothetical protein